MARKIVCAAVGVAVGLALLATPVSAGSASATKILFKLDEHEVTLGDDVAGRLLVLTKGRFLWWPLPNAELTVSVDGVEVGTVRTNVIGFAKVSVPTSVVGEHTMEVSYAGDATHNPALRSQGFTVRPAAGPGVPDAPVIFISQAEPGLNYLQWEVPVPDNGSTITGYRVYRGTMSGELTFFLSRGPAADFADDMAVTSGTTYYYAVTAVNAVGESSMSNEVAITAM